MPLTERPAASAPDGDAPVGNPVSANGPEGPAIRTRMAAAVIGLALLLALAVATQGRP